ncbi:MAG: rhomboid family intramembrane serine protease [Planctomycetota bacterium]|nr:rhomboid family intramembrane serine protease [Planctomycetota bacterium]MDP6506391.1 rhomboid family intramembrane serine protease [Planctomycetota bacterium]
MNEVSPPPAPDDPWQQAEDEPPEQDADSEAEEDAATSQSDEPPMVITADMLAPETEKENRIDFEQAMPRLATLALVIIGILTVVFIWQLATGALDDEQRIIDSGALHRPSVDNGQVWRLMSAIFLHGNASHLVTNCVMLYILGIATQHAFGAMVSLVIFLFSGLTGSCLSIAIQVGPSVGASGAIFGLLGATIVFFYRFKKYFYLRDHRIGFVLIVWAIYNFSTGFLTPFIDNFAHLGGFIGGGLLAFFFTPRLLVKHDLIEAAPTMSQWQQLDQS